MLSKFFILLLAFSFIVGQLIRLDIFGVQFPLLDAAVFLYVTYHILTKRFSWEKYLRQKWLLVFIGVLIASNIINTPRYPLVENVTGSLYLLRFIVYSLIVGVEFSIGIKQSFAAIRKIQVIGLLIGLIGILQFIFYPSFEYIKYQNWDEHLNRLVFPYFDPSFTGAILLIFLVFSINSVLRGDDRKRMGFFLFITFFYVVCIYLTFSRATWVTAGIIFIIYIFENGLKIRWFKLKRGRLIGLILGFLIFFIFVGGKGSSYGNKLLRTETIFSRLNSSQKGLQIWKDNSIFGVGYNHYKSYLIKSGVDRKMIEKYQVSHGLTSVENSYIFILATGGLIGFIIFLIWIKSLLGSYDVLHNYIFISILAGSLFNNIFFYPFILLIIFVIVSIQPND